MPVAGEGPSPARGMIVGEAPTGREEHPFTDLAGRRLRIVLHAVGVKPKDVYMTYVVKETPRNDEGRVRRPNEQEIAEWLTILRGEVQHVDARAILALGTVAVKALTGIDGDLVPAGSKIGNVYTAWHPGSYLFNIEPWFAQVRPWAEAIGRG